MSPLDHNHHGAFLRSLRAYRLALILIGALILFVVILLVASGGHSPPRMSCWVISQSKCWPP
jgi:hypothetical protein